MAATGRRDFILLTCGLTFVASASADDSADVHKVIGDLATALSNGEVAQAMALFSKKFANYDRLNADFDALAGAYYIENRLEFPDEEVSPTSAEVAVRWDLALTTQQSGFTKNRSAELTFKLTREGKHWKILDVRPLTIFDPQDK